MLHESALFHSNSEATAASLHANDERLTKLWRLSVQQGLSDAERIRAMLEMAASVLGMDRVLFAEAGAGTPLRCVADSSGLMQEGDALHGLESLWQKVSTTGVARHAPDLAIEADSSDLLLSGVGAMRLCSATPVRVGEAISGVLLFLRASSEPVLGAADHAYMELAAAWLGNALFQSAQLKRLEQLALTDSLTGLPNRRTAEERLQQEAARAQRKGESFALALIDLDYFKLVNDRFGHALGDEVLRQVAQRLQSGLREGDWIARWGGEEFLFFLHDSNAADAVTTLERLAERIRTAPVATSAGSISLTFSAGVSAMGQGGFDLAQALDGIDAALYKAKTNGRDRVCAAPGAHAVWSGQTLKSALAEGRLKMATQLIVDLQTGEAIADESLARVVSPDGSILEAKDFIEMAEGLGLMPEIDRQIVRLALNRCMKRLGAGASPEFSHFVNLSPQFLARRDLVEEMLSHAQAYCQSCGVTLGPVKPIVLELTERQRINNLQALRADLQPFIDFGFRLALDDFGSGYSSFVYLAQLPVTFLKIEGWLVANMRKDRKVAGIVESLAILAQKEGILTVAEQVEDAETSRILQEMGVNYGQGWLFGRPQIE